MTEAEIEANAASDPDNPPMTDAEFARARTRWLARKAREASGLSQAKFADLYHLNRRTLQGWEAGRSPADEAMQAYLKLILLDGRHVQSVLSRPVSFTLRDEEKVIRGRIRQPSLSVRVTFRVAKSRSRVTPIQTNV